MERFPPELLYVLIFLGIVVFQFFARRLQQRAQQAEEAARPAPPAAEEPPLEDVWGRTPVRTEVPQPVAALAPLPARIPLQAAPPTGNLLIWLTALAEEDDDQYVSELADVTIERAGP